MKFANIRLYYNTAPTLDVINFDFPVDEAIHSSPYILRSVDGLGPPDISLTLPNTIYAGATFQGAQPLNREIIMRVGFQPNYSAGQTVADLRTQLYSLASPRLLQPLTIKIMDEARETLVRTTGYIKKIEPSIFSSDPELVITISCLGPFWKKWGTSIPNPTALNMGVPFTINNPGDAPSGFKLIFTTSHSPTSWWIRNAAGEQLTITYAFVAGNSKVTIDTTPGQRWMNVQNISGGSDATLLPYQAPGSRWLMLDPGLNFFTTNSNIYTTVQEFTINANFWGV